MKRIKKAKKVVLKKRIEHEVKKVKTLENTSVVEDEVEDTILDMTGWEDEFHYEDMRGLFFIQKGQFEKSGPRVLVKDGKEYDERYLGGYDPSRSDGVIHYCVIDRVTFHTVYGGSSLDRALESVKRVIKAYNNDCERYFRQVCESTNDDFYNRHYMGYGHDSDETLKRRAEEGRCWKTSSHTKRTGYAVMKLFGYAFCDLIEQAEEEAISELEEERKVRRAKKLKTKRRKVRIKK